MEDETILTPTASVIRGVERIGSVGDLRIRYLAALGQGERTQVWVVGCFDNPNHPPQSRAGGAGCQSELFALAWQLILLGARSKMEQATTFLRGLYRRMLLPCHHQDLQDILEPSIESPNVKVRGCALLRSPSRLTG